MTVSAARRILRFIKRKGEGWVFAPQDLLGLGSRAAVDQTLSRLVAEGVIRRIGRGLYDVPRRGQLVAGGFPPSPDLVAAALVRKTGSCLQISGAAAANVLGLSDQVPDHVVFLTDGVSRKVEIGDLTIELRHAEPRRLLGHGSKSTAIVEALRYLGPNGIGDDQLARLRIELCDRDRAALRRRRPTVPAWLLPFLDRLLEI